MSIIPQDFILFLGAFFSVFCHISRKSGKIVMKFVPNGENKKKDKFFKKRFAFFFTMLYNEYDG